MRSQTLIFFSRMFQASGLILALQGGACLKNPKAAVKSQDVPLSVSGQVQDSFGQAAAGIGVFVEQETTPEQITDADGRFSFSWSSERKDELKVRYGGLGQPLRLYFTNAGFPGESAVYDKLKAVEVGNMDLGIIRLQTPVVISGQVMAPKSFAEGDSPAEGALVHVGRLAATTDLDGNFRLYAPSESLLPVRISLKGYVQTKGIWNVGTSDDNRDFRLYDRLIVDGRLEIPTSFRTDDPNIKSLNFSMSGNAMCRWVRLALSEEELSFSNNWMSLDGQIQIPISSNTPAEIFYQFSDQDKQTFSPAYSLRLENIGSEPITDPLGPPLPDSDTDNNQQNQIP